MSQKFLLCLILEIFIVLGLQLRVMINFEVMFIYVFSRDLSLFIYFLHMDIQLCQCYLLIKNSSFFSYELFRHLC